MTTSNTRPPGDDIQVRGDYGKDDDGLSPGWYAEGHSYIAGPAPSGERASDALVDFLYEEGHLLDDETASVHVWKATPPVDTGEPRDDLFASAKDAQAEVASWPKWKQEAAARARVTPVEPPGGVVSVGESGARWCPVCGEVEGVQPDEDLCGECRGDFIPEHTVDAILNRGRAEGVAACVERLRMWADHSVGAVAVQRHAEADRIERTGVTGDALSQALAAAEKRGYSMGLNDGNLRSGVGPAYEEAIAAAKEEGATEEWHLHSTTRAATAALEQRVAELGAEVAEAIDLKLAYARELTKAEAERDAAIARAEAAEADRDEWKERSELQFIALEMTTGERAERDRALALLAQCEPVVLAARFGDAEHEASLRTLLTNIRRALGNNT